VGNRARLAGILLAGGVVIAACGGGGAGHAASPSTSHSTLTASTSAIATTTTTACPLRHGHCGSSTTSNTASNSPTTTTVPPTTTTTPLPRGLGVSLSTAETFFGKNEVPITWHPGASTNYGTKVLGKTKRGNCFIEFDGPSSDLREISVFCSTAGASQTTSLQAYAFMSNAVDRYAGTAAVRWFTTELDKATTITTTATFPNVKKTRTMTNAHIQLISTDTLQLIGVAITAAGVPPG
jgi:hypothetical protein